LTKEACQRVFVITGTTSARKLSTDVALAAQSSATVVVLMGMSKLNEIVSKKRPKENTCCDYSKRNYSRGKIGLGTINSIEQVVFEQN
jgi:uroporphyrin-III C-methyltransferase